jgi:predicted ATPase
VTFLFTDIEDSTPRWEVDAEDMRLALAAHDELLGVAISQQNGYLFKHTGDGVCAAFASPRAAVDAAISAQRVLQLPVRMGIATGEAELRGDDYFGLVLSRTARVMSAGHGGQILVAGATAALLDGIDVRDLGAHRLKGLSAPVEILQVLADGLPTEFPPLRTHDVSPGNLPAEVSSFLGREDDVAEVADALHTHRVVTLVGVGGVGKTQLALHAAAAVSSRHRDGVWLVELAPVLDAADVPEAVAAVFTVTQPPQGTWVDAIAESLERRELLLVLDNCEHVLDAAARLCDLLAARCPNITVLATSREALGVTGERAHRVPSLDVGEDSPALALFIDRAAAVEPAFDPGPDRAAIVEIVQRLDGIPLAIELAAARVRSMSPMQIRDRLDERFRLLTGSRRSIERHQTLHQAVQWSYDLLTEDERTALRNVAVFAAGFTLAAAAEVCAPSETSDEIEMLDLIDSLVRKSLVVVDRASAEPRYTMLETVRQFAEERLVESGLADELRHRHATYFAVQAERAFDRWAGPGEAEAYRFVDQEIANLRAAFRWSVDHGHLDPAVVIAASVHTVARMRLRTEHVGWAVEVLEGARTVAHRKLPLLLSTASDTAWSLGRLDEAKARADESIACADDPRFESVPWGYIDRAEIALFEDDITSALEYLRRGAAHPSDDAVRVALAGLVWFSGMAGQQLSDEMLHDALTKVKARGFPLTAAIATVGVAAAVAEEDLSAAIELYEEAIGYVEAAGNRLFEQRIRSQLAGLLATSDDPARALASFVDIVDAWRISGDTMLAEGIAHLAALLARLGRYEGAAQLYAAATRGVSVDAVVPGLDAAMASTREALGDEGFDAACTVGYELAYDAAGALACQLIAEARTELGPGV